MNESEKQQSTLKSRRKRTHRDRFPLCYAAFCAVLVFAVSCGVGMFYDFISEYEKTLPEHVIESYIESLGKSSAYFFDIEEIRKSASGFETEDSVAKTMSEAAKDGLTFTRSGDDEDAYDIYCGGKFLKLTLTSDETGRYGFPVYRVATAEIYPEWIAERRSPVTVIVPEGTSLTVNGAAVGDKYMLEEKFESTSLSEFDRAGHALVTYEIGNVFGGVDVAGTYNGEDLKMTELGEGAFCSDYDLASRRDYTVTAPEGAVVKVGGVTVTSDCIVGSEEAEALRTDFEPGKTPKLRVYKLPAMLGTPELEVTLDGEALTQPQPDGTSFFYPYPDSYKKAYTVKVPVGTALYCNGIEVGDGYITEADAVYGSPLTSGAASVTEHCVTYTVHLCHEPEFTVSSEEAAMDADGTSYVFYPIPTDAQRSAVGALAQSFTEQFIRYNMQGYSGLDANYSACMSYTLAYSEAYEIIAGTYYAVMYNDAYSVTKLTTRVYDFAKFSDTCISVKVDFESHGVLWTYEKDNNGSYTMVWVLSGGVWKLSGLSL